MHLPLIRLRRHYVFSLFARASVRLSMSPIDREFEFYDFFHSSNLTNFTNFFRLEKTSQKIRNFANHRCLTCIDVLECNVHL